MRTSSPPPPIPVPPRSLARTCHTNSFALCPLPHSQQLITAKVEMLLNVRFPKLAPWGKGTPRNRRWDSILMNKFKNERVTSAWSQNIYQYAWPGVTQRLIARRYAQGERWCGFGAGRSG